MDLNTLLASFGDLYDVASKDVTKNDNHVPQKKYLIDSGHNILFSNITDNELIFVFDNGFVLYQTDEITSMTSSTVFPLKWTLKIASELEEVSEDIIRQTPSVIVLSTIGKNRIEENINRNVPIIDNEINDEITRSDFDLEKQVLDEIAQEEIKDMFTRSIPTLTKLQKKVLDYRYCYNYTQQQTGEEMKTTRANIQKIEEGAFKKLRKFFENEGYSRE